MPETTRSTRRLLAPVLAAAALLLSACDPLPGRLRTDPPGTALNTSSSRWYGVSSTGAYSNVRQVSTGLHQFSFKETWLRGKGSKPLVTIGKGSYTPATASTFINTASPLALWWCERARGKKRCLPKTRCWRAPCLSSNLVSASPTRCGLDPRGEAAGPWWLHR